MSDKIVSFVKTIGEVLNDTYTNYKGRVITKINSHSFTVGKFTYTSLKDAKDGIDDSYSVLANSLKR